jgi:DNA-binding NtrC family response regulator
MARRILIVEDDRDVMVLLQHVLLDAGYAVECAPGVKAAQSLLKERTYDLVLTDGKLGDGSGIEVADDAVARRMKALVMTGYSLQMEAEGGLERHRYLIKPVRPREIVDVVARTLGAAQA